MNKANKAAAEVLGHERISGSITNCEDRKECETVENDMPVCTYLGVRLWGKASDTSPCNIPLFEKPEN